MKKMTIMFQLTAILVSISFFLFNCGSSSSTGGPVPSSAGNSTSAKAYVDSLAKIQEAFLSKMRALNASMGVHNPENIRKKFDALQEEIKKCADAVSEFEGFKGDTSLRDALLDQLEFYEAIYDEEGRAMIERFIDDPEADDLTELMKRFKERLDTEGNPLEEKLITIQSAFLKKHSSN